MSDLLNDSIVKEQENGSINGGYVRENSQGMAAGVSGEGGGMSVLHGYSSRGSEMGIRLSERGGVFHQASRQGRSENAAGHAGDDRRENIVDSGSQSDAADGSERRRDFGGQRDRSAADQPAASRGDPQRVDVSQGLPGGLAEAQKLSNYHFNTFEMGGSETVRIERNLQALRVLKKLETENTALQPQEQAELAAYAGWGGLAWIFRDDLNPQSTLGRQQAELKSLLSPQEYEAAEASSTDAFYTPPEVLHAVYAGLQRTGALTAAGEQLKVLEPSAGIGNFIGSAPEELNYAFTAVELDHVSSRILKRLYPQSTVLNQGFQELSSNALGGKKFDLAIGNPPFGQLHVFDEEYSPDLGAASIHSYFIAKAIDQLHEGGIGAFVVSRWFLDSTAPAAQKAREYIANRADLLGAVRLPADAFTENAGTNVVTDVVFFRRHGGKNILNRDDWLKVDDVESLHSYLNDNKPVYVNHYYRIHPDLQLGEPRIGRGPYGYELTYKRSAEAFNEFGEKQEGWLEKKIIEKLDETLPENVFSRLKEEQTEQAVFFNDPQVLNSESYRRLKPGQFFKLPDGSIAFKEYEKKPAPSGDSDETYHPYRLELDFSVKSVRDSQMGRVYPELIDLRDNLRRLMDAEYHDAPESELNTLRTALNQRYDAFVQKFGYINGNKRAIKSFLDEDAEGSLLAGLEINFDRGISKDRAAKLGIDARAPSAEKADIFRQRVIRPYRQITEADSPQQALAACIQYKGRIDADYMAELLKERQYTVQQVLDELESADLVFYDPEEKQYALAADYLSGDVRHKLKLAEEEAQHNPALNHNVQKLTEVIPADLDAADINLQLNSPWVPDDVYTDFAKYLTNNHVTLDEGEEFTTFDAATGRRIFAYDLYSRRGDVKVMWNSFNMQCSDKFSGTDQLKASDIFKRAVNGEAMEVKTQIMVDGKKKSVTDLAESLNAENAAKELNEKFVDWVWSDQRRRQRLTAIYNELYNCYVPPHYDGSELHLTGASPAVKLRPHQKDAILRNIVEGGGLVDHVVGAGKTMVAVATVMEQKRSGIINKPLIVVPNHLLAQWKSDFNKLYPDAKLLIGDNTNLNKKKKQRFLAQAAMGSWDAIVVQQSSFGNIKVPVSYEQKMIEDQIYELRQVMENYNRHEAAKFTIKEQQALIKNLAEQLRALNKKSGERFEGLDFSDLGVDCLVVDEAHNYKNLRFITTKNTKGLGNTAGSAKAWDLFMKVRWLQEHNHGKGVFFLTGTPISNSLSELYHMQRYLQLDDLKAKHLDLYDEWHAVFAKEEWQYELDATGVNYKLVKRVTGIKAPQEVISMYRSCADVVTQADLNEQAKKLGIKPYVPKVKGGHPINVVAEPSPEQLAFMQRIVERMEAVENGQVDSSVDNALKITSEAVRCGLDFRTLDPHAPDFPQSKVNLCVDKLYEIWARTEEEKGTQLVFCDRSVPKSARKDIAAEISKAENKFKSDQAFQNVRLADDENDVEDPEQSGGGDDQEETAAVVRVLKEALSSEFSVYDDIKTKLIQRGVPADEIAFIHDAKTPEQKRELFYQVNEGKVRILIGSTSKMGVGMNVQKRLVASHNLDCPWRPADLEQRNGRIIRQGNMFYADDPSFEVEIYNYSTKRTYDARMWQVIETKGRMIDEFRRGQVSDLRMIEDVDSLDTATAADMKAAATGNPLILMEVRLKDELQRLQAQKKAFDRSKYKDQNELMDLQKRNLAVERQLLVQAREELQKLGAAQTKRDQDGRIMPQLFLADGTVLNTENKENTDHFKKYIVEMINKTAADTNNVLTQYQNGVLGPEHVLGSYRGLEWSMQVELSTTVPGAYGLRLVLRDRAHDLKFSPDNFLYTAEDLQARISFFGTLTKLNNFIDTKLEPYFTAEINQLDYLDNRRRRLLENAAKPFKYAAQLDIAERNHEAVLRELQLSQQDPQYESHWVPEPLPDDDADLGAYVQSLQESVVNALQQPLEPEHQSVQTAAAVNAESTQSADQAPELEAQYMEPQTQDDQGAQAQISLSEAARPITDTLAEVDLGQLVSGLRQRAGLDPAPAARQTSTADAPFAEEAMLQAAVESDHLSFVHLTADFFMGRQRQRPAADGENFAASKKEEQAEAAAQQAEAQSAETVGTAQPQSAVSAESREHVREANIKKMAHLLHWNEHAVKELLDPQSETYKSQSTRGYAFVITDEINALFKQSSYFKNYMSAVKLVEAFRAQDGLLDIDQIDPAQFAADEQYVAADLRPEELSTLMSSAERQYREAHNVNYADYALSYANVPHLMLNYTGRERGTNDTFSAVLIKESTAREVLDAACRDVIFSSEQEAFKALLNHQYASGAVISDEEYQMLLYSGLSEHKHGYNFPLSSRAASMFITLNSVAQSLRALTTYINSQKQAQYRWHPEDQEIAEFRTKFGRTEVKPETLAESAVSGTEQSAAAQPEGEPSAVKQEDQTKETAGSPSEAPAFADVQLRSPERADLVTSIISPAGGLLQLETLELQTADGSEQFEKLAYVTRRQMLHELEKLSDFKVKQPNLTRNEIEALLIGMMTKVNELSSVPVAMLPDVEQSQFDAGRRTVNDYQQYLCDTGLERLAQMQEHYDRSYAVSKPEENTAAQAADVALKLVLDAAGSRVDHQQAEALLSTLRADLLGSASLKQSAQVNTSEEFKYSVRTAAEKFLTTHYEQYGSAAYELLENAPLLNQVTDSFKIYDQLHEVQTDAQVQEAQAESRAEPAKVHLENVNVKVPQFAELKFVYKAKDGSFKPAELRYFDGKEVESFMDALGVIYPAAARQQFTEACNQAGWQVMIGTARGLSTFAEDQVRSAQNLTSLFSQLRGNSYQEAAYQALRAEDAAAVMAAVGDSVTVPRSLTATDLKRLCTNLNLSAESSELLVQQGRSDEEQAGLDRMANAARFANMFFSSNPSFRARQIIALAEKQYSSGFDLRQSEDYQNLVKDLKKDAVIPAQYQDFLQKYHNKTFGLKVLLSQFIVSGCTLGFTAEAVNTAEVQEQQDSAEHESAASQSTEQKPQAEKQTNLKQHSNAAVQTELNFEAQSAEQPSVAADGTVQKSAAVKTEPPLLLQFLQAHAQPQSSIMAVLREQAEQAGTRQKFLTGRAAVQFVRELGRLTAAVKDQNDPLCQQVRALFNQGDQGRIKQELEDFKHCYFTEYLHSRTAGTEVKADSAGAGPQSIKSVQTAGAKVLTDFVMTMTEDHDPFKTLLQEKAAESHTAAEFASAIPMMTLVKHFARLVKEHGSRDGLGLQVVKLFNGDQQALHDFKEQYFTDYSAQQKSAGTAKDAEKTAEPQYLLMCYTRDPQVKAQLADFKLVDAAEQVYSVPQSRLKSLNQELFDCHQADLFESSKHLLNGIFVPHAAVKLFLHADKQAEQGQSTVLSSSPELETPVLEVNAQVLRDDCVYINPGKHPQLMAFVDGCRKVQNTAIYEVPYKDLASADPRVKAMPMYAGLLDAVTCSNQLSAEDLKAKIPYPAELNAEEKTARRARSM